MVTAATARRIYIVDDDSQVRQSTYFLLDSCGFVPRSFASGVDFLDALPGLASGCVLLDVRMPAIDGLKALESMQPDLPTHPVIVMTGHGDVTIAVRAMKLGATDFIEKPFGEQAILEVLELAFAKLDNADVATRNRVAASERIDQLSNRERDVLRGLLAGSPNKVIAFDVGLSTRTVEMHRARMMERLAVRSLSEALKLALAAGLDPLAPR